MLVHQILQSASERLPQKTALIEGEHELSYAETWARALALAAALQERGVSAGDRVALLFPNCIEFCVAYFGVLSLGAVVVPINNRLAPKEFEYIINDSGSKVLILGYQFWESYLAFCGGLEQKPQLIYAGEEPKDEAEDFAELSRPGPLPAAGPELDLDHPACIMYTSGTTGLPKGAEMSHRNILANARNCGAHLGYRQDDISLVVVPLFHVTGLNSQLVALFYTGGTCVIMRAYNTAEMIVQMERYKVTATFKVPTMYTLMLVNEELARRDLSSLRLAAYGGAPMDPQSVAQLQQTLGVGLFNCYGLTETSSLTTVLPACEALRKSASVGLPVSGVQVRVVDEEGDDLGPDEVGELYIKGPNVISRYWNKPQATAENLADGWLKSGDYARIDQEGFIYIVDRKKDMINRGGENIYCIEVEAALLAHGQVLEAAVVPRPHSIFGESVHAFVVPAPGATPGEEELIAHCRGLIADFKVPASIGFLEEMPRNPGGKVLKTSLREMVPPGDAPRR